MSNLNLDPNQWHQWWANENRNMDMLGTSLFDKNGTEGAVFFQETDLNKPGQNWQFFPINSTTYAVRTKDAGPKGFLAAKFSAKEAIPGNTVPYLAHGNITDETSLWHIGSWGDGTFYMWNQQNGTDWHLNLKDNGLLSLSSNITAPQKGQRFSFKAVDVINDPKYSSAEMRVTTVRLGSSSTSVTAPTQTSNSIIRTGTPSATPSATLPSTASSTPTESSSSTSQGLSGGEKGAIGGSIAGFAVVFVAFLALILRRRQRRQTQYEEDPIHEMGQEDLVKYEMYTPASKDAMAGQRSIPELAGDPVPPR